MMIGIFLLGLIGLGIMVFVHELGHFVAAKANGVVVETFSLGWGPRLIGFKRGGTVSDLLVPHRRILQDEGGDHSGRGWRKQPRGDDPG